VVWTRAWALLRARSLNRKKGELSLSLSLRQQQSPLRVEKKTPSLDLERAHNTLFRTHTTTNHTDDDAVA
jgi:hypothetical protein